MAIVERDERGRIVQKELSSDEARAMAAARRSKEERQELTAREIVAELGYDRWEDAGADIRALALKAAGDGAQSVGAMRLLLSQAGRLVRERDARTHWNGQGPCPMCGRGQLPIGPELAQKLLEALRERSEKGNGA